MLGWMPSRMQIRGPPSSSMKTSFPSELISRNTRLGSTALVQSGHRRSSCSIAMARNVYALKAICRTMISMQL